MDFYPLPLEQRVAAGADYELLFTAADLTDGTDGEAQVLSFPITAKMIVECVEAILDIPFQNSADNTNNTTTMTVGDGNGETALLTSTQINANGSYVPLKNGTGTKNVYATDDTIDVTVTPKTGTPLNALDTGQARLRFRIKDERGAVPLV